MSDVLCIDASVAVKTLLEEIDSLKASNLVRSAVGSGIRLIAPLHFPVEVTSALYKRVRPGMITLNEAVALLRSFDGMPMELLAPDGLRERALAIAATANMRWIYDAFYVALAEIQQCELWTADEQLYTTVSATHLNVRLLSMYG